MNFSVKWQSLHCSRAEQCLKPQVYLDNRNSYNISRLGFSPVFRCLVVTERDILAVLFVFYMKYVCKITSVHEQCRLPKRRIQWNIIIEWTLMHLLDVNNNSAFNKLLQKAGISSDLSFQWSSEHETSRLVEYEHSRTEQKAGGLARTGQTFWRQRSSLVCTWPPSQSRSTRTDWFRRTLRGPSGLQAPFRFPHGLNFLSRAR